MRSKLITPDRAVLIGAIAAALVYLQDLRYDFILDDIPLILLNETITSWRNWKTVLVNHIFSETTRFSTLPMPVHYRPVYQLWQMLNAQLFGLVLPWWHLTSLLLHMAAVLLVYQVGLKLVKERWTSALAALLFAVHPIHAESVAYVAASTDLLVTVFALVSFLAYFHFREDGASPVYFALSVLASALAMFSKETGVMIPWMLVAYEALPETVPATERNWKRFLWTAPYFAVVGAYIAVRTVLFGWNTGSASGSRLAAFLDIPLVLVTYLRNLFWPFQLSFFYPREWSSQWTLLKGVAAVVVIAAGVYLWRRYRLQSGVRLQLLWTGILFVPSLLGVFTFAHEDWVHDRHMYLVSVPISLVIAALLTYRRWPAKASVVGCSAILAILAVDLAVQVPRFKDENSIYTSALKVAPSSLLGHFDYGTALLNAGRKEEGLREYRIMTEIAPQAPESHEYYAGTLADVGRYDEALKEYQKALDLSERSPGFHAYTLSRMAALELKLSEYQKASDHLREAVQLSPQAPDYYALLAQALSSEGQTKEAEEATRVEAGLRQRVARERGTSRE
ncbi:MAG TPA: tetratricopeptide repeat protein [Verrucomicrobiae bacterium]|nr:tetratricopeptide repeat protein [Verrucomicrobiae bacterium]